MKYVVFEAGSRAGFSSEMFFLDYVKKTGRDDVLYMVDDSLQVNEVETSNNVKRINFFDFLELDKKDMVVFPADELSRQSQSVVYDLAKAHGFSDVDYIYYYKKSMNKNLHMLTYGCKIKVP